MSRNRPNAFEVSFPEEAAAAAAEAEAERVSIPPQLLHTHRIISKDPTQVSGSFNNGSKRKIDEAGDLAAAKRRQLPKVAYYQPSSNYDKPLQERNHPLIPGEDFEGDYEDDKPVRVLLDFTIFDPKHRNELVSLSTLEDQADSSDREFEVVGKVLPYFVNDEDEGQEDEEQEIILLHLSAIYRFTLDYKSETDPVYIETKYAWYILRNPSKQYTPYYQHFYALKRVAQLVISSAWKRPQLGYATFLARFTSRVDPFGTTYLEQHLSDATAEIQDAVADIPQLRETPLIKEIFRRSPPPPEKGRRQRQLRTRPPPRFSSKLETPLGNLDNSVLKPENQNPTHVTPLISTLANDLVREELVVVGPRPPALNKSLIEAERRRTYETICRLISTSLNKRNIDYDKNDKVLGTDCYRAVMIDGVKYKVGDVVVLANGNKDLWQAPGITANKIQIPTDARLDDYFWFAKLIHIDIDFRKFHLQWFSHGSDTMIRELAHPQELFLSDHCESRPLNDIMGKITVHNCPKLPIPTHEFFCRFMWDEQLSTFTSTDVERMELCATQRPPDNCPVCPLLDQRNRDETPRELKDENNLPIGVQLGGRPFHVHDFVLYRSSGDGPAHIGYILKVEVQKKRTVKVKKVGRICDLENILPPTYLRDERHLFLTDQVTDVDAKELLKVVYVPSIKTFESTVPPKVALMDWLDLSFDHFYLRYKFSNLQPTSWQHRTAIEWRTLRVCKTCYSKRLDGRKKLSKFLADMQQKPLPTLDLFGGVGAFSKGLTNGSGCLNVTHAVEISPSAAKTFKQNSPGTIVYNQCANTMLRYAIKSHEGHKVEVPSQIYDLDSKVPPPPERGTIKVIVAGFPCQSHSTMNMYKLADDVKSNLILTALSWIDFYRPDFVYFENVPGFLQFSLNATQVGRHRIEGGIEQGGLKLTVRAMVDMGYQVRYALLQAAHYGTPQRRLRFFLVATQHGLTLPELPQPTHHYDPKGLVIKQQPASFNPVRATPGTTAYHTVTIDAAISDLPRFDWKHPHPEHETPENCRKRAERATKIRAVDCKPSEPYSGFRGRIGYGYDQPRTSYQQTARMGELVDMQQYTRCFTSQKVERVLNIPLKALADYRDLPYNKYEWQFADPSSATGRKNYKPGMYGRPDKNGVFQTTVTNVEPTAKQSFVLNPYCHRMFTVRELARSQGFPDSFVFKALKDNVITMHRQIGNAVPLPVGHAFGRQLRKTLFERWRDCGGDVGFEIADDEQGGGEPVAEDSDDDMYL